SADNSFIALSAARKLAYFAAMLKRPDAAELEAYASNIEQAIEQAFWLTREGYYAMRVTPDGKRDKTPLSIGLLRPIVIDSLNLSNEHAIESVIYTFKHLYKKNGFIRLIPSHDQTITMAIGYL